MDWFVNRSCPAVLTGSAANILVGVLAEDVPDDHNSFLDHIVDLGLDQVQQGADTALSWLLEKNRTEAPWYHFLCKNITETHDTTGEFVLTPNWSMMGE